jgi:hypothetical protein
VAESVSIYVNELLRRQIAVADQLGVNVLGAGRELYCINLELLLLVGVLMKALSDKGVVSDAEWLQRLDVALEGDWPPWIKDQTPPP